MVLNGMFTYLHVLDPEIPIDSKENMIETLFKGSDSFFFKKCPCEIVRTYDTLLEKTMRKVLILG